MARRAIHLFMAVVGISMLLGHIAEALSQEVTYERLLHADQEPTNWLMYYGNYQGWRYSPLQQINTTNVQRLVVKWQFHTGSGTENFQVTPLVVDGVMAHAGLRLLIVDDQSPDGTGDIADSLAATCGGRIEVLHRTGKRGLGLSIRDGFERALGERAELICQMDADLSHDPASLPALIAAAAHADVTIGSRYVPGGAIVNWPYRRRVLSRFANMYVRAITRLDVHDCTSGFRCWHGPRKIGELAGRGLLRTQPGVGADQKLVEFCFSRRFLG